MSATNYLFIYLVHRMAVNRKRNEDVQYWSGRATDMIGTVFVDTVSFSADLKTVLPTGNRFIVVVSLLANELVSRINKQGRCGLFGKMN